MPDKAAGVAGNAAATTSQGMTSKTKSKTTISTNNKVNFSIPAFVQEPPASTSTSAQQQQQQEVAVEEEVSNTTKPELYKSNRLKGYLTLILAGIINYSAAVNSQTVANNFNRVAATDAQRAYAEAVAITSCLISGFVFLAHLDRWSPLKNVWSQTIKFGDGSMVELLILIFLVLWWTIATAVGTSVSGIAGDGKGQFNLFFSTWCCCLASYWTLERWLVAYGWASFKSFISSWPFRAPGWIAIGGFSFMCLMWYLDLYSNHTGATKESIFLKQHYEKISDGQWNWLLFCAGATLVPAFVFISVELFRETTVDNNNNNNSNGNKNSSTMMEGGSNNHMRRFSVAAVAAASSSSHSNNNNISPMRRSSRQLTPLRQNPLPDKADTTGGKGPLENILEGCWYVQ
jgi:hypothetical protein